MAAGVGGVLFVGVPFAALAEVASHAPPDRGGHGCCGEVLSVVREFVDGWGGACRLGGVLLSRLPQTGVARAARVRLAGLKARTTAC
ncbi:hypothetical protein AB0B50_19880 [Streptomyces sp. NPDC041068]|uniref:hypothetical protein n=1 Tax=Streptomyces sp. NPDC041068 TaxID=3155130 RepID=UPI0033EABB57